MRDYVGAVKALWHSWQTETPLSYESDTYNLNLSVPLFTPDPIAWPIPIQIAAVNPLMCAVAAEVADGVRLHPVCCADYIRDVVDPALRKGQVRRQASTTHQPHLTTNGFEVCLKPLIATARDSETLSQRREIARQRLAFYLSTPAYRGAFDRYGLEDLANELAQLSKAGRWAELAPRIPDTLLEKWVLVATYEQLAQAVKIRYGELIDRIELSIPVETSADREQLTDIVAAVQAI